MTQIPMTLYDELDAQYGTILAERIADIVAKHWPADEKTEAPQAPIAKVIVSDDGPAQVLLYAPGMPIGEHDLYCEPEAVAPFMRGPDEKIDGMRHLISQMRPYVAQFECADGADMEAVSLLLKRADAYVGAADETTQLFYQPRGNDGHC